jgi:hypothetical protein
VPSFEATVAALVESIIRERCSATYPGGPSAHEPVVRFLLATHAQMPDYLRLPFRILTLTFDLWPLPRAGATFHRLPHPARWRQVRAWQGSALGFRRDLIRFYETLAIFGWYAEVYGHDYHHGRSA